MRVSPSATANLSTSVILHPGLPQETCSLVFSLWFSLLFLFLLHISLSSVCYISVLLRFLYSSGIHLSPKWHNYICRKESSRTFHQPCCLSPLSLCCLYVRISCSVLGLIFKHKSEYCGDAKPLFAHTQHELQNQGFANWSHVSFVVV